jgi:hypothetical protein
MTMIMRHMPPYPSMSVCEAIRLMVPPRIHGEPTQRMTCEVDARLDFPSSATSSDAISASYKARKLEPHIE